MWMSSEDARSDFILAAAAAAFGGLAVRLLQGLPLYPDGFLGAVLRVGWVVLVTAGPAYGLVRHRRQGLAGYGYEGGRDLSAGLLLAVPVLAVGYVRGYPVGGPVGALFGNLGLALQTPTVGPPAFGVLDVLVLGATVFAVALGGAVLYPFLTTRARDGFRQTDLPLVEGLRTYGIGAAGIALVLGLLVSVTEAMTLFGLVVNVAGLVALVLLTDRLVTTSDRTSRATLLAPAIVAVVLQVLAFGGFFGGNILFGLFRGAFAGGTVIVVATLVETRRHAWAAVPLVLATAWSPTCMFLPTGVAGTNALNAIC
jgi:hypothetical protein